MVVSGRPGTFGCCPARRAEQSTRTVIFQTPVRVLPITTVPSQCSKSCQVNLLDQMCP